MADKRCGTCDMWIVRPHHGKSACLNERSFLYRRETDGERDGRTCGVWELRANLRKKETENG